ncbi:hypothetical protein GCM10010415_37760 [Streptomyces atrovirens]
MPQIPGGVTHQSQGNSNRDKLNHIPSNSNNRTLPIHLCSQSHGGLKKGNKWNNQPEWEAANT